MAYDSNSLAGLSSLSPTVSAYKNFVEQKDRVNDANIVPFLLSRGEPQLAGLIAKKLRLDQAANSQQQIAQQPPAAPPTVAQQYDSMLAQQQAVPMQQQDAGLAAMPNPAMDRANFAEGGIVAFKKGGWGEFLFPGAYDESGEIEPWAAGIANALTPRSSGASVIRQAKQLRAEGKVQEAMALLAANRISPEQAFGGVQAVAPPAQAAAPVAAPAPAAQASPSGFDLMAERAREGVRQDSDVAAAPAADVEKPVRRAPAKPAEDPYAQFMPEKPKTEAELREARLERERAGGYGQFSQATADEKAFIEDRKKQAGQDEKTARKDFWVMLGASLLGNRSPYFATALGESVKENYGNLIKDLRGLKKEQDSIKLLEIQLRRAQETAAQSGDEKDRSEAQRLGAEYRNAGFQIQKHKDDLAEKVLDRKSKETIAGLSRMGNQRMADEFMSQWDAIQKESDPAKRSEMTAAFESRLNAAENIIKKTTSGGVTAETNRQSRIQAQLLKLEADPSFKFAPLEEQQRRRAEVIAMLSGSDGDYVPQSGNVRNPYAGFSATPLP